MKPRSFLRRCRLFERCQKSERRWWNEATRHPNADKARAARVRSDKFQALMVKLSISFHHENTTLG